MLLLKNENLVVESGKKVIKARDYAGLLTSAEIIAKAEAKSARMAAAAREVYKKEKKHGYEDGLREGQVAASTQLLDMASKSVNYFASLEEQVVEIVVQALKRILGSMEDKGLIVQVVRNALAVARTQHEVKIRVAPSQVSILQDNMNKILADYPGIGFLQVVEDARLTNNGCILETDMGIVEASVEVQIEAISKALTKSFRRTP